MPRIFLHDNARRQYRGAAPGPRAAVLMLLLALALAPSMGAQASPAKRAIEDLEGCSEKERREDCVRILKQEKRAGERLAVKAKIRGGRIIWYEYDRQSGRVRRLN
jgi:hypothetical protein